MLRFSIIFLTLLATIYSCRDKAKTKGISIVNFVYPTEYNFDKYSKMQIELRKDITRSLSDTTYLHISKKTTKGLIEIFFKESLLRDKKILVPAKFNLDTKKDYSTPVFNESYMYVVNTDTLIDLNVTKDLFVHIIDSNLAKYGVLKSLATGSDIIVTTSDSFHLKFILYIPGTKFAKRVTLAGDSLGAYIVY